MIYLTSDTHFFHKNVIKYDNRPFTDIHHMNETIINNWNEIVHEDDLVIHLGDFVWGGTERMQSIFDQLNGNKILIKGNHDRKSDNVFRKIGFIDCMPSMIVDDIILCHYPIYRNPNIESQSRKKIYQNFVNRTKANNITKVIHGHIHNNPTALDSSYKQFNVSCCAHDYKPIKFETIKQLFSQKS